MESTKISMPTSNDDPLLLDHHSSSTRRKNSKRQFILVLVICFTLILAAIISVLAVLKRRIDSESPAKNPALAIQSVCSTSGYYYDDYCFRILSPLRNASDTNPTQIFTLAVRSAIDATRELTPLPDSTDPETKSTLSSCEIALNETLSQLTAASTALGVDPGTAVRNLTAWLSEKSFKIRNCLDLLKWPAETGNNGLWTDEKFWKIHESTLYARSSFAILRDANMISETFNPAITSTLASFLAGWDTELIVCVFGLQYLYLLVLFCIFFRLY